MPFVVFQGVKTEKNNEKLSKNCFFGIINSKLAKTNIELFSLPNLVINSVMFFYHV